MDSKQPLVNLVLVCAVAVLGAIAWAQHAALTEVEEKLEQLGSSTLTDNLRSTITAAPRTESSDLPAANRANAVSAAPLGRAKGPAVPVTEPGQAPNVEAAALDDPEVRTKLREVISEEQQVLREQRWAERQERREAQIRERVRELAANNHVDGATSLQLEDLLVTEQAEISDLFRAAREDGSWGEMREKATGIRAETDEEAELLLDAEQYAQYKAMRAEEEERWGRRGPRDGRRSDQPRGRVAE